MCTDILFVKFMKIIPVVSLEMYSFFLPLIFFAVQNKIFYIKVILQNRTGSIKASFHAWLPQGAAKRVFYRRMIASIFKLLFPLTFN